MKEDDDGDADYMATRISLTLSVIHELGSPDNGSGAAKDIPRAC
jgi:hypothetical protein